MITAHDLELRGCRLFNSCDLEETRSRIAAVMQPHRLEPIGVPNALEARMDFVDVAGLGLGVIKFGKMRVSASHVEDYHLLILCRRGTAVLQGPRGEIRLNRYRGACLAPGSPLRAEFSSDCEQFVLRIGRGLFGRHTEAENPRLPTELDLSRPQLQPWMRLLWAMAGSTELTRQHPKLSVQYQHLILNMLANTSSNTGADKPASVVPYSVKRAEAFILENAGNPICLEDIARAAEVPTRTLLNSFRRFCRTTPMSYLRTVRLDRVRKRLLDGPPTASVTAIALEEGFTHLGRFSHEYASRFGERPSQTLRMARG